MSDNKLKPVVFRCLYQDTIHSGQGSEKSSTNDSIQRVIGANKFIPPAFTFKILPLLVHLNSRIPVLAQLDFSSAYSV